MNDTRTFDPIADRSAALADLVDQLTARAQAGEVLDPDALAAEFPAFAGDLARLVPAFGLLAELSRSRESLGAVAETAGLPDGTLGDFRIIREAGRGAMGVVYEAEQLSLCRRVALKVLPFAAVMDPRRLQRFRAEALAAAGLDHPHVVKVFGVGCERGVHYIAMQFIDGRTLADLIRGRRGGLAAGGPAGVVSDAPTLAAFSGATAAGSTGPVPDSRTPTDPAYARRVAEWGIQAAEALEHAHALGVVHRDIKPGNLLIDGRGRLFVADFGLAKLATDPGITGPDDLLGTLRYMSPEQAAAEHDLVDHRSDVYSLGATLYELLTLVPAFDGPDRVELLRRIAVEEPTPPRRLDRRIPPDLETIVLKCLEKDPARRYQTAGALAADLRRFLGGEPIRARRVGAAGRGWRWVRRHPAPAALGGILLALAAGVPPVVIWNQNRFDTARDAAAHAEAARQASARAEEEANKLAVARELFAIRNAARRRAADRPVGWTRANLADLRRAAGLAAGDPTAVTALRSEASTALLASDLREVEPLAPGFAACVVAASPDGSVVALGEFRAPLILPRRVLLVDPVTGATVRTLKVPAGLAFHKPGVPGPDGVRSLAFSPDGKRLFVGTRESKVHRFDLDDPGDIPSASWPAFKTSLDNLAVSPDGRSVYGSDDSVLLRWDAETGEQRARCIMPAALNNMAGSFAVDPAGDLLLTAGGGRIYGIDPVGLGLGHRTRPVPDTPGPMALLPGRRVLAAGVQNWVGLFDPDPATDYRLTARLTDPRLRSAAHETGVSRLAAHPSRPLLATASTFGNDRRVKVWEAWSGRPVGSVPIPGTISTNLAWTGGGRYILATSPVPDPGRTVRWELVSPAAEHLTAVQKHPVEAATLAPDGRVLTVGPQHRRAGVLNRWVAADPPGGPPGCTHLLRDANALNRVGVAAAPGNGGRLAITRGRGPLVLARIGTPLPAPPDPANSDVDHRCPQFSPDGSTVWVVENTDTVRVLDATTGAARGGWKNTTSYDDPGLFTLEALAGGRTRAVASGRGGTVFLLDHKPVPVGSFPAPGEPVLCVALAPDESVVVAGTQAGRLRVIPLAGGPERVIPDAHPGGATAAAFAPSGSYLATGGKDRAVKLWRVGGGGAELLFEAADLAGPVATLEFSADGGRLMVHLAGEHAVRVWDLGILRGQLADLGLGW